MEIIFRQQACAEHIGHLKGCTHFLTYLSWIIIWTVIRGNLAIAGVPAIKLKTPTVRDEMMPLPEYRAVAGSEALLPCNVSVPSNEDAVSLVLWYRGDTGSPIYSIDARNIAVEKAKHFSADIFGTRAEFDMSLRPAALRIQNVREEDAAEYRCRVDYRWARTQNSVMILNVIVAPKEIVITDAEDHPIVKVTDSYPEGSDVHLRCLSRGGKPLPALTWWRDSLLIDDTYTPAEEEGTVRNDLVLTNIQRDDLMAVLTCQATNTNLTAPLSKSVTLDVNLKPLDVHITNKWAHLLAGKKIDVECQSRGSRPPAQLTWWKNKKQIPQSREIISEDGNFTSSVLVFSPSKADNGVYLACRSENVKMPDSAIEDGWILNVYYPPQILLSANGNSKGKIVKEGNEIQLQCNIEANPWVAAISWRLNRKPLVTNPGVGIIISNTSLTLMPVRKEHSGVYQCDASNLEGKSESNELNLEVQYAPVCKAGQKVLYGVATGETVTVVCEVEAEPPEATFHWVFNNSNENSGLLKYTSDGLKSSVLYTPRSKHDFGTLLCWTKNAVGKQRDPCVFTILPAGPPEPVSDCLITNYTNDALLIECNSGYDGGLQQFFHLEVYDPGRERLLANLTKNETPSFYVTKLSAGTSFLFVIYSSNAKGKSTSVVLTASTLVSAGRRSDAFHRITISPILGILIGVIVSLVLIAVIIVICIKKRRQVPEQAEDRKKVADEKSSPVQRRSEECDLETKSPDVIPPTICSSEYPRTIGDHYFQKLNGSRDKVYDSFLQRNEYTYGGSPHMKLSQTSRPQLSEEVSYEAYPYPSSAEMPRVSSLRRNQSPHNQREILSISTPV